jgi:hypothetical protein
MYEMVENKRLKRSQNTYKNKQIKFKVTKINLYNLLVSCFDLKTYNI